jgi:hypothetical protein
MSAVGQSEDENVFVKPHSLTRIEMLNGSNQVKGF